MPGACVFPELRWGRCVSNDLRIKALKLRRNVRGEISCHERPNLLGFIGRSLRWDFLFEEVSRCLKFRQRNGLSFVSCALEVLQEYAD